MNENNGGLPKRLEQIITEFEISEGREKLELLLDYAQRMRPIPEWLVKSRDQMEFVPECMTPVYVHAETNEGKMTCYFDVPDESPTVRGYAAIMAEGVEGASPEDVLAIPGDFYRRMGLEKVLSYQRLNGLSAILAHMKRLALQAMAK